MRACMSELSHSCRHSELHGCFCPMFDASSSSEFRDVRNRCSCELNSSITPWPVPTSTPLHAFKRTSAIGANQEILSFELRLELGSFPLAHFSCLVVVQITNTPTPPDDAMPRTAATARAVLNALPRATSRQCPRFMSTARSGPAPAKRPTAPSPAHFQSRPFQPLAQRRMYKTVEEAKSRYRSGVCVIHGNGYRQFEHRLINVCCSPSRGKPAFCLSLPAAAWYGTLRTKRGGCSARGSPSRPRAWAGPRSAVRSS
jgi:hypothetical protein